MNIAEYWDALPNGGRVAFAEEVAKYIPHPPSEPKDKHHVLRNLGVLVRAQRKGTANPYIRTAIAIEKASEGKVPLASWKEE
jgi:hypothetical protein